MVGKTSASVLAALAILTARPAAAQPLPPVPVAPSFGNPPTLPAPLRVPEPPPRPPAEPTWRPVGPSVPPPVLQEDTNQFVLPGSPPPQMPCGPPPGLFAALELSVLSPNLNGSVAAPVSVAGVTRTVGLAPTDLDWTGSPRFELGY